MQFTLNSQPRVYFSAEGNVGIGTNAPGGRLHIWGPGANGGDGTIYLGDIGTGQNVYIKERGTGDSDQLDITAKMGIYLNAGDPAALRMTILSSGVGIGTDTPAYPLDVNGVAKATAFLSPSDRRLKENIKTMDGLTVVRKMRGVSFAWKTNGEQDTGVIAQELEQVLPFLVATDPKTGFKAVRYSSLISPLIEATKELDLRCEANEVKIDQVERRLANVEDQQSKVTADVERLKADNAKLRDENQQLKERLDKIERALNFK